MAPLARGERHPLANARDFAAVVGRFFKRVLEAQRGLAWDPASCSWVIIEIADPAVTVISGDLSAALARGGARDPGIVGE